MILGVDRLDTIKGIPHKYQAFEKFLEENEDWRGKVLLLQIAVPTRNGIGECKFFISFISLADLHRSIHRIVLVFYNRSKDQRPMSWSCWTY